MNLLSPPRGEEEVASASPLQRWALTNQGMERPPDRGTLVYNPGRSASTEVRSIVFGCALDVGITRAEGLLRPCLRVVYMPPGAARVVGQQVDGDRRLGRGRAYAMDVVVGWEEGVEVARAQRAALDEPQLVALARVDLLVLLAAVQADEAPREVVVDRRRRAGWDDEREQRERFVAGPVEQPLPDPAAHAAVRDGLCELVRKPALISEQLGEARADRLGGVLRRRRRCDGRLHVGDEVADDSRVEDVLVAHVCGSLTLT